MWCHLHGGDGDDPPECRPIGLELLHVGMKRELRCNMIWLWAGVTPSLRAYQLVYPSLNTRPLSFKNGWVVCPCGVGPQDCLHVLTCTHVIIQDIRSMPHVLRNRHKCRQQARGTPPMMHLIGRCTRRMNKLCLRWELIDEGYRPLPCPMRCLLQHHIGQNLMLRGLRLTC